MATLVLVSEILSVFYVFVVFFVIVLLMSDNGSIFVVVKEYFQIYLNSNTMKKFLLSVAAVAMTVIPSLADEISITWGDKGYTNAQDVTEVVEGDVTLNFDKGSHTLNPKYYNADKSLRLYFNKNGGTSNEFSISVPEGFKLDKIVNDCVSGYVLSATPSTGTLSAEGNVSTWTPTEETTSVNFVITNASRFVKTTVEYSQVSGPALEAPELSFPHEEYEAQIGEDFVAPELTKATNAPAVYSSSNEAVATVDPQTGAVTLVAQGTTVITAACAANDTYRAGNASYTLIVKKASIVGAGSYTIVCDDANRDGFGGKEATMEANGVTFAISQADGVTAPAYNASGADVRVYANGTITVSAPEGYVLTNISFYVSSQGLRRLAAVTADEGEVAAQTKGDDKVNWTGVSKSVTFTVGAQAEYGSDGATKAGQLCFTAVDVTYEVNTGVSAVDAAEGEATYFDLNGRQVKNPAKGLYIKVVDGKASKVIVK